jgi:hypothetical protein
LRKIKDGNLIISSSMKINTIVVQELKQNLTKKIKKLDSIHDTI